MLTGVGCIGESHGRPPVRILSCRPAGKRVSLLFSSWMAILAMSAIGLASRPRPSCAAVGACSTSFVTNVTLPARGCRNPMEKRVGEVDNKLHKVNVN